MGILKKLIGKDDEGEIIDEVPKFSSKKELDDYVGIEVKKKLEKILDRAKEKSVEIEEEWSEPKAPAEDIAYFVEDEEQEEIVPKKIGGEKKPRPYKSYAEIVLEEVEKERKK